MKNPFPPKGVIRGQVLYSGPAPCTENGRVVGAAIVLLFDTKLLPPPEGLGTSAQNLAVVPGDVLFSGIASQLQTRPGGARWCPDPGTTSVTVAAPVDVSPVEAGTYQLRGFYDYDGDFFPLFKFSNLPTKGDVGGGAVANPVEVLAGAAPVYQTITIGNADGKGGLVIPETGSLVEGVSVSLAKPLPLERPYFWNKKVEVDEPVTSGNPGLVAKQGERIVMPADYWVPDFSQFGAEHSLIRVTLGAGVEPSETDRAKKAPFSMHLDGAKLYLWRFDANGDGVIDKEDSIPETPPAAALRVPALLPLVIWAKLDAKDPLRLNPQASPVVIIQGITAIESLPTTIQFKATTPQPVDEVLAAVRPAAICLCPLNPKRKITVVTPHEKDASPNQNPVLIDQDYIRAAVAKQFGRASLDDVEVAYRCLPQGEFSTNVVYDTGQAWTVPHEGWTCLAGEERGVDLGGQPMCGVRKSACAGKELEGKAGGARLCGRTILPSQGFVLEVGAPGNAEYCKANPVPPNCTTTCDKNAP